MPLKISKQSNWTTKYTYTKQLTLVERECDENVRSQIEKDAHRTFIESHLIDNKPASIAALTRILTAYSMSFKQLGYTQGMNFLCASLLYHATESVAFELFRVFMECFLIEIYEDILPKLNTKLHQFENQLINDKSTYRIINKLV